MVLKINVFVSSGLLPFIIISVSSDLFSFAIIFMNTGMFPFNHNTPVPG